jgi:peptidoglycan/LPS O-acetylase OafA/YrhL
MSASTFPDLNSDSATLGAMAPTAALTSKPRAQSRPLPPKPKSARYQSLDMWRGVACLMLVFYHCTFYADRDWRTLDPDTWSLGALALNAVTRLWIGVPMFFVVSGYCIAASVDSLRRKPHSLANYFARRFRRIYPPLWAAFALVIAFCLLAGYLWPAAYSKCAQLPRLEQMPLLAWLGNFTATESWLPNFSGAKPNYLMLNTWTLCYEEQFYFITGVLLLISARNFFAAAAIVTGLVFSLRVALSAAGCPLPGFFFDGHWLMFALGLLVYQHINYFGSRAKWATWLLVAAGVVYGLSVRALGHDYAEKHLGEYLAVASAFALALILLKRWDGQIASHRLTQPLVWCGKISYSVYLTHFPLLVFASAVLALYGVDDDGWVALLTLPLTALVALPAGWVFYMLVERHFVNAPQRGAEAVPAT